MKTVSVAAVALFLLGASQLSADTAIGNITLQNSPANGYQIVTVNNFTGLTYGCEAAAPQYQTCVGVTIQNWRMELDFTSSIAGLTSPLVFTSQGSQDDITPTSVIDSYTGDASQPWTLPLDVANQNCVPTCDAEISQIIFSGTLDTTVASTLFLYNGSTNPPYQVFTLASQNFSVDMAVTAGDYADLSNGLYLSQDILVSEQAPAPEPAAGSLIFAAVIMAGLLWRAGLRPARRS